MASAPSGSGERNSAASSTRSAARNAADRIGPASTITRVIPRPARPRSTAARSSRPFVPGTRSTSTPACVSAASCSGVAPCVDEHPVERARRALPASREPGGSRRLLSSTTRTGERCVHAGQPAGELRVVGQHRADAGHDRVVHRAHQVHARARRLAGDRGGLAARQPGLAVGRHRELQGHMRAAVAHAAEMPRMGAARLLGADADIDRDAVLAQPRMALAGDLGVRVFQRRDDARDARRQDGVDAGRGLAVMRAGLERRVKRRAARRLPGAAQRLDLGMRPPARLGPAAPDHDAVAHHHGADRRVRPRIAEPAPPERQRQRHEAGVEVRTHPGSLLFALSRKAPRCPDGPRSRSRSRRYRQRSERRSYSCRRSGCEYPEADPDAAAPSGSAHLRSRGICRRSRSTNRSATTRLPLRSAM